MSRRTPHISISEKKVVYRVLRLSPEEFENWPEEIQELATRLASELFLIRYNPFIPTTEVYKSVFSCLQNEMFGLDEHYYRLVKEGLEKFWQEFLDDQNFKIRVINRLQQILPKEHITTSPNVLVECATDATDLRIELPMLLVSPNDTKEVQSIIQLARELQFKIVPRGGGSGLTGGAIPATRRNVILSLSRMKSILDIHTDEMTLCAQSGVITLNAIQAAEKKGLLFTVDPASKAASSLGGNIAENAGGPFAFEYGTTLDNILNYTMVLPSGKIIKIQRKNHPKHKILPTENAIFDIFDEQGNLQDSISLKGDEIRAHGLGKDVTNKYLGGLPGIQKEGVDGIITEACFTLHQKLAYSQTLCLEFFGNSMHTAMLVIYDLVQLRDTIRNQGDLVKMSALEEFGTKYVQAISYQKKSINYEGEPISVLLVQLDSNEQNTLRKYTQEIVKIADSYHNVDVFVAKDSEEAEKFWQDRHKLSAITRRTSGFKINEDVVIPIHTIPEFSDFIENLNLYYLALAYRNSLQKVYQLEKIDPGDQFIDMELNFSSQILGEKIGTQELSEQEFELQIHYFFRDLISRYPEQKEEIEEIEKHLFNTRIMIANHMHAGDGNCHVNIPVHSNNAEMLRLAEDATQKIVIKVMKLAGTISGEHGIGITKIGFLPNEKIQTLRNYKSQVDPDNIFNPGKLTDLKSTYFSYTFSFNHLIQDIYKTSLPQKERLIALLKDIQICSRCGKCKQICPMYYPEQGFLHHPRNKIISLGALIEALYYTKWDKNQHNKRILEQLQDIITRCNVCGKCTAICPVKIDIPNQVINMRAFLEEKASGGHHPLKTHILRFLIQKPERIPKAAKLASVGQNIQKRTVRLLPETWRERFQNPLFKEIFPKLDNTSLVSLLKLDKKNIILPKGYKIEDQLPAVFYFPGCGGGIFYHDIGLAAIFLLLKAKRAVVLPDQHLCCGYPLLASGCSREFERNKKLNTSKINDLLTKAQKQGLRIEGILTSCGTCREALHSYEFARIQNKDFILRDIVQYIFESSSAKLFNEVAAATRNIKHEELLYHASCHSEWEGLDPNQSGTIYAAKLGTFLRKKISISPECCGESGLGALTSPSIFKVLKERKRKQLQIDLKDYPTEIPILVGCPSCKIGLNRILLNEKNIDKTLVLHSVEYIAQILGGESWREDILR